MKRETREAIEFAGELVGSIGVCYVTAAAINALVPTNNAATWVLKGVGFYVVSSAVSEACKPAIKSNIDGVLDHVDSINRFTATAKR